ncbi:MAG: hypothetical protein IJW10_03765 [Clostridia bacterium]|nr:hypothetical protein [Clostridia bacterium]
MDLKNGQNGFSYTYSAKEQQEIKKIRQKYEGKTDEENKMERVRRLDARVTQRAQCASLILGIVGALVLGLGMSLIMTTLGDALGVFEIVLGVFLGLAGGALVALAYPTYSYVIRREREKIAPEMLRLTDELMK